MLRVGLTGGIGSGKSTVSSLLGKHGAIVIDADLLAREVVAPGTPGLAEVVVAFGSDIVSDAGELDRQAMGVRVFGDSEARRRLEAIIHPRVRARAGEIEQAASPDAVVVHEIPLLVETGQAGSFDAVVVVDVSTDVQLDRLRQTRGMTVEGAQARITAQADRKSRLAAATHVISNDGSIDRLRVAVDALWTELRALESGFGS